MIYEIRNYPKKLILLKLTLKWNEIIEMKDLQENDSH